MSQTALVLIKSNITKLVLTYLSHLLSYQF